MKEGPYPAKNGRKRGCKPLCGTPVRARDQRQADGQLEQYNLQRSKYTNAFKGLSAMFIAGRRL
jgi:hypothetical protein